MCVCVTIGLGLGHWIGEERRSNSRSFILTNVVLSSAACPFDFSSARSKAIVKLDNVFFLLLLLSPLLFNAERAKNYYNIGQAAIFLHSLLCAEVMLLFLFKAFPLPFDKHDVEEREEKKKPSARGDVL